MSGFVAVVNTDGAPVDRGLLARLTGAMAFRGPDAQRIWCDGPVGLGHTLLATVDDYPEVPQPFSLDGRVWLAGDVRVDGRAELVAQLKDHVRAPLATASDPELVLHAYHAWGERCVEHLIGDFAFVIWDGLHKRLTGARDHMGVRPFYFAKTDRALVISNSLDAVRAHPYVSSDLDDAAIADFLMFGEVRDGGATAFARISRLPAAHRLTCQDAVVESGRFWSLPIEAPLEFGSPGEYVESFSALFRDAVRDRLRTDRVGVSMSGGLDSTAVAAEASQHVASRSALRAVTAVLARDPADREGHFAAIAAEHLGIQLEVFAADDCPAYDRGRPDFVAPEPTHAFEGKTFLELCRRMHPGRRVVLTGWGADPALAPWTADLTRSLRQFRLGHLATAFWQCVVPYKAIPRFGLRTAIRSAFRSGANQAHFDPPSWLTAELTTTASARERVQRTATAPAHRYRRSAFERLAHGTWASFFEGLDPSFTGERLEFRHPFMDVRVLGFLLRLPSLPWCVNKHLLREWMRGRLPDSVRLRGKSPVRHDYIGAGLREHGASIVANFTVAPQLFRFVNVDKLPSARELASATDGARAALTAFSLNEWLLHADPGGRRATQHAA